MRLIPVLAGLFWLVGITTAAAAPAVLLRDHPLVDTLWDARAGRQVEPAAFFEEAVAARWILLGEQHNNADHHRLQARVLGVLADAGRRPAVVWEMAGPDEAEALRTARLEDVDYLGAALRWEARGWPAWADYRPIAEQALRHGLPLRPGNAPGDLVRRVSRGEPLPPDLADRLDWQRPYPPDIHIALLAELAESHCGRLPVAALPAMARVQRLWDAFMAEALSSAGERAGSAVLIAGSGHVRKDRAVPWHLLTRQYGSEEVLVLAFVEVTDGLAAAADYGAFDPSLFDYVWFTARVDAADPCAAFGGTPSQ